jgi:hypothetical protein
MKDSCYCTITEDGNVINHAEHGIISITMSKPRPCGCHYEFKPWESEFQIAKHLCTKHFDEAMIAHKGQAARRWKWPIEGLVP